jgi:hypothetical protein
MASQKPIYYLVVGFPRSGTTLIRFLIGGHPGVGRHPNVVSLNDELAVFPFFSKGISTFTFGNNPRVEKEWGFMALYHALTSIFADEKTMAMGAKCACGTPEKAKVLVDTLQKNMKAVKIILVERKDLVAQFGSSVSGKKSGLMHSWYKTGGERRIFPIRLNKWEFQRYALRQMETYEILGQLRSSHDVFDCVYEDYLKEPSAMQEKLFNFLGVQDMEVTWLLPRKVMPPAKAYIQNYGELTHTLNRLRNDFPFQGGYPPYILYAKAVSRLKMSLNIREKLAQRKYKKTVAARRDGKAANYAIEINDKPGPP